MPAGPPLRSSVRRAGAIAVLAVVVLVGLVGCQAKVSVTTKVDRDGSGTVAVGVGLDDPAMARLGTFDGDVRLADLAAAGWAVTPARKESDGLTWLRATKLFADPSELTRVLAEINGPQGLLQGFTFVRTEDGETTYRLTGTIDPTKGVAVFGDPELAARLDGDPFAGVVQQIEQAEGRPAADMVSIDVTAQVADGTPMTWHPTLKDTAPTAVDVSLVDPRPPSALLLVLVVSGVALALVVGIVQLTRTRRRFHPTSTR
jgi:hypothetical protein